MTIITHLIFFRGAINILYHNTCNVSFSFKSFHLDLFSIAFHFILLWGKFGFLEDRVVVTVLFNSVVAKCAMGIISTGYIYDLTPI